LKHIRRKVKAVSNLRTIGGNLDNCKHLYTP
jgi:hypothetical protein